MLILPVLLAGAGLSDDIPIPLPRPDTASEPQEDKGKTSVPDRVLPDDGTDQAAPAEIEPEDPAKLKACLAALDTIGVAYKPMARMDDGGGCGMDHPLEITSLADGVVLDPKGAMRCETALQLALWVKNAVKPALQAAEPGESLAALQQASAYVCRKRNGAENGKISEHARGNAVDVAGLRFKSGKTFLIEPRKEESTLDGALQRAISASACLYFTTVLDPGSDKAHETHLHLDVIQRKNDYRYCW